VYLTSCTMQEKFNVANWQCFHTSPTEAEFLVQAEVTRSNRSRWLHWLVLESLRYISTKGIQKVRSLGQLTTTDAHEFWHFSTYSLLLLICTRSSVSPKRWFRCRKKSVRKVLWTRKGERATLVTAGHCTHAELTSGHALASCYSCCVHSRISAN